MVSVVVTSYNRFDLLQETIETFNQINTYPIEKFIIIEDSTDLEMKRKLEDYILCKKGNYQLIFNETNQGQVESIDIAYSQVKTPYVFHSEDDYEFFRPGFIERSIEVLENDPLVMQVWIRRMDDTTDMPVEPEILKAGNVPYHLIGHCINNWWHGFCFQCGLRKMSAYERIRPFAQWSPKTDFPSQRECKIGQAYYALGYRAAILPEGYARHTGQFRSVSGNENK